MKDVTVLTNIESDISLTYKNLNSILEKDIVEVVLDDRESFTDPKETESIAIDAEWKWIDYVGTVSGKKVLFLTKQYTLDFGSERHNIVLWDSNLPYPSEIPKVPGYTVVVGCDVNRTNIFDLAEKLGYTFSKSLPVYMYYSPIDVMGCLLNREKMTNVLLEGQLSKKRNLYGTLIEESLPCKLVLRDLIGAFNTSLDEAFDMVGINNPYKNLIPKELKGDMEPFFIDNPNNGLAYALGDTAFLHDLWINRVQMLNDLVKSALDIDPGFTVDTCPRSSGALVSTVFLQWLADQYPELMTATNVLADVTKREYGKYKAFKKALKDWNGKLPLKYDLGSKNYTIDPAKPDKVFFEAVPGLARASIKALGNNRSTSALNAIVMGGRCRNEHPREFILDKCFDPDELSCYGTTLTNFYFPIGKPLTYGRSQDDVTITLGNFLEKHESDFVDTLWQIVVEGDLSFDQDLIYSKLNVTPESILKDLDSLGDDYDDTGVLGWDREVESAHVGGDFVLMDKKIVNGIITSDTLEAIRKVSATKEFSEWMNLTVSAACWYSKEKEVTPARLTAILKEKPGGVYTKDGNTTDSRTTHWCKVSLSQFVGRFVSYRKTLKKQKRSKGDEFDLKQNAVKLFINTVYGCFAAPYFAIGNVVLANNITARARLGIWMLSKALGTIHTITDGGLYKLSRRLDPKRWEGKKPSFNTLSDYERLNKHRSIEQFELFDFDSVYNTLKGYFVDKTVGDDEKNTLESHLNNTAKKHINDFWGHYGLVFPFDIEHKLENTSKRIIFWGSSDYLLIEPAKPDHKPNETISYPYSIRVRGAKQPNHPKKLWLFYLDGEIDSFDPEFRYTQLIGFSEWMEDAKRNGDLIRSGFLPGEEIQRCTVSKPNFNHLPVVDDKAFNRRKKAYDKAVRRFNVVYNDGGSKLFGVLKELEGLKPKERQKVLRKRLKKEMGDNGRK